MQFFLQNESNSIDSSGMYMTALRTLTSLGGRVYQKYRPIVLSDSLGGATAVYFSKNLRYH